MFDVRLNSYTDARDKIERPAQRISSIRFAESQASRVENMCGFAGVIAWDERYRVSQETLAKMSAAIAHRGPDGEGFHLSQPEKITPENPQVALAFRRLAILDPDPRSM